MQEFEKSNQESKSFHIFIKGQAGVNDAIDSLIHNGDGASFTVAFEFSFVEFLIVEEEESR